MLPQLLDGHDRRDWSLSVTFEGQPAIPHHALLMSLGIKPVGVAGVALRNDDPHAPIRINVDLLTIQ
jgi:hypothetical protein